MTSIYLNGDLIDLNGHVTLPHIWNAYDNIISNDCNNLQGITAEHLDELTMVNIALLTLLMWSIY